MLDYPDRVRRTERAGVRAKRGREENGGEEGTGRSVLGPGIENLL